MVINEKVMITQSIASLILRLILGNCLGLVNPGVMIVSLELRLAERLAILSTR